MASLPTPAEWQRLSPWLDELLDLSAAQRAERLAALAATDSDLASTLQAMLEAEAAPAQAFLHGQAEPAPDDAAATLAGLRLGAYTLEAPLGQGGAGTVWRARRCDGRIEQQVAVKLLHLALLGQAAAQRFRREGSILAKLSHPHIAGLLDAGVSTAGQPYLVLELVEGEPIDQYCERLQLAIEERLRCFLDVLAAVDHAHRHLVVHRDIKPSNVLVNRDGQVKLLDFGIAKLLDTEQTTTPATELTRMGGRALTPAYAAPEQFAGGAVTTATDVYALGVLLFQLLAGRHPWHLVAGDAADPTWRQRPAEPERLSHAALQGDSRQGDRLTRQGLSRRLAGDLDNIVARMLRSNPAERYPTVAAVADDVRRHLDHLPVSARPDAWRYRAGKFMRRHRAGVATAALLVVAILAGLAGTVSQAQRAREQASIAQAERDRALRELGHAEAANEFIGNVLTEGSRRTQSSVGLLDQASALLAEQFASTPTVRARMQLMLATMYAEMREEGKAIALLTQAAALADGGSASLSTAERSHVECLLAALRQDSVALDRALVRLLDSGTEAVDTRHVQAICLTRRSTLNKQAGRLAEAEQDARRALALLDREAPGRQLAVIHARRELASAIGNQGNNAAAAAEWRALLADLAAHGRGQSVYAATAHNNLFVRLSTAGQEQAAYEQQLRALAIWTRLQGEEQLDPHLLANLATSLDLLGRNDEAMTTIQQALARLQATTPAASRRSTWVRGALLMCRARRQPECNQLTQAVRDSLPADLPAQHFDRALLASVQAAHRHAADDFQGERLALQEAVRIADASAVRSGLLPGTLIRLAQVELRLGDPKAALAAATRAQHEASAMAQGFRYSSLVGRAASLRGEAEAALGEREAARLSLTQAVAHLQETTGAEAPPTVDARRLLASLQP